MITIFQITNPVLPFAGTGEGGAIIGNIISSLVGFALIIGTIGTLAFFILGALRWIGSGGDKNRLQAAQDEITHAIIGLIILVASWAIFLLVTYFIGLGTQEDGGVGIPLPGLQQVQEAQEKGAFCKGSCIPSAGKVSGNECSKRGGFGSGTCGEGFVCCQK